MPLDINNFGLSAAEALAASIGDSAPFAALQKFDEQCRTFQAAATAGLDGLRSLLGNGSAVQEFTQQAIESQAALQELLRPSLTVRCFESLLDATPARFPSADFLPTGFEQALNKPLATPPAAECVPQQMDRAAASLPVPPVDLARRQRPHLFRDRYLWPAPATPAPEQAAVHVGEADRRLQCLAEEADELKALHAESPRKCVVMLATLLDEDVTIRIETVASEGDHLIRLDGNIVPGGQALAGTYGLSQVRLFTRVVELPPGPPRLAYSRDGD